MAHQSFDEIGQARGGVHAGLCSGDRGGPRETGRVGQQNFDPAAQGVGREARLRHHPGTAGIRQRTGIRALMVVDRAW